MTNQQSTKPNILFLRSKDGMHVLDGSYIIGYRVTHNPAGEAVEISVLLKGIGAFAVAVSELTRLEQMFSVVDIA